MTVIKRNGRKVEFNKEKIYNAIIKAFTSYCKVPDDKMNSCA